MKWLVAVTLLLLAVAGGTFAWHRAVYDAYSRDFGQLTPAQFTAMNAQMARLTQVGRLCVFALLPLDVALLIASIRRRAFVSLALAVVVAALLGLVALAAGLTTGAAMIG
jgi:hypothetical protein